MRITDGCALLVLGAVMLAAPVLAAPRWTVEHGSAIRFVATQQGAPVEGGFQTFTAEIAFDPEDLAASRVAVAIDVASIATGHKDRDATLRSAAFFDVETWPRATFVSDELRSLGGDRYQARGRLAIRDVTREVVLPFELTIADGGGARHARATAELTISRLDFGVGQGEWAATKTVGGDVVVRIEIVASAP
jgi:polyisoprenoid-binding protein YceI